MLLCRFKKAKYYVRQCQMKAWAFETAVQRPPPAGIPPEKVCQEMYAQSDTWGLNCQSPCADGHTKGKI